MFGRKALRLLQTFTGSQKHFQKLKFTGFSSQMRRAVVSVSSNIAEGAARASSRDFCHFLNIAGASLSELDTQLEIANNLHFITHESKQTIDTKIVSISSKLTGLIKHVKKKTDGESAS